MSLLWCPKGSSLSKPWTCSYSSDYFHHHAKEISLLWVLFTAMLSIPFCREWEVWTKHNITWLTVFENQPKSRIQHCERSELRLHFEWTKIHQKWSNLTSFWLTEATFQTVLPDKPLLIGQKLMENAKIEKSKCNIWGDFQTLCQKLVPKTKLSIIRYLVSLAGKLLTFVILSNQMILPWEFKNLHDVVSALYQASQQVLDDTN